MHIPRQAGLFAGRENKNFRLFQKTEGRAGRDLQLSGFQAVQRFVSLALILRVLIRITSLGDGLGGLGFQERGQAMAGKKSNDGCGLVTTFFASKLPPSIPQQAASSPKCKLCTICSQLIVT